MLYTYCVFLILSNNVYVNSNDELIKNTVKAHSVVVSV